MNLLWLSNTLEKLYNTLGNDYLTQNFHTEPFEFKVKVRRGIHDEDLHDYVVEVSADRKIPKSFKYKDDVPKKRFSDGIDISVLRNLFKEYASYIDPTFGDFRKTIGVNFL